MPYEREAIFIDRGVLVLVRRSEKCPYAIRAVEFLRERLRSGGQYQQAAFGEILASKKKPRTGSGALIEASFRLTAAFRPLESARPERGAFSR
jgi:hypothetical protein